MLVVLVEQIPLSGVVGLEIGTFTHATGSGSGSMSTITAPGGAGGSERYEAATDALVAGTVGGDNKGVSILGGRWW